MGRATSAHLEHLGLAIPEAGVPLDLPLTGAIIKSLPVGFLTLANKIVLVISIHPNMSYIVFHPSPKAHVIYRNCHSKNNNNNNNNKKNAKPIFYEVKPNHSA